MPISQNGPLNFEFLCLNGLGSAPKAGRGAKLPSAAANAYRVLTLAGVRPFVMLDLEILEGF